MGSSGHRVRRETRTDCPVAAARAEVEAGACDYLRSPRHRVRIARTRSMGGLDGDGEQLQLKALRPVVTPQ
jgi:hypothetical protein